MTDAIAGVQPGAPLGRVLGESGSRHDFPEGRQGRVKTLRVGSPRPVDSKTASMVPAVEVVSMGVGTKRALGEQMAGDPRVPAGFVLGIAFGLMLAVAALFQVTAARPSVDGGLVVTTAVTAVAAWWSRVPVAFATGITGWLMINGFLVNQHGQLRWHGGGDLVRLGVLVGVGVGIAAVRAAQLKLRRRRVAWSRLSLELAELMSQRTESRGESHA